MRVALAGYGLAGRCFHAPLLAATPGLELVRIVTGNPDRRAQATSDWPRAQTVGSVTEALGADVELLVVATANDAHVELARAAIARGVAVVVDKPLALTAADAAALVAEAEAAEVPLTVFHNRRWDSDVRTLRTLMEAGRLGTIVRFESRFERWRPEVDPDRWRSQSPAEGGGLLLDLGTHLVDQALMLFGPVRSVYAEVAHIHGLPADDDAFIALHHRSGVISHLHVSSVTGAPGPRMRALGTAGAFVIDGLDGQEDALRAGARADDPEWGIEPRERWGRLVTGERSEPVPSERGDWPAFYTGVAQALRADGEPPVDPRDAVTVLRLLEAARLSSETGNTVPVA